MKPAFLILLSSLIFCLCKSTPQGAAPGAEFRFNVRAIAFTGKKFIAVGGYQPTNTPKIQRRFRAFAAVFISEDGKTFRVTTLPADRFTALAVKGDTILAGGGDLLGGRPTIHRSTDHGASWKKIDAKIPQTYLLHVHNGYFYSISTAGEIHRSKDGLVFTRLGTYPDGKSYSMKERLPVMPNGVISYKDWVLTWGNSQYLAQFNSTYSVIDISKSATGVNTIRQIYNLGNQLYGYGHYDCCFGEAGFKMFSLFSTDAKNWQAKPLPDKPIIATELNQAHGEIMGFSEDRLLFGKSFDSLQSVDIEQQHIRGLVSNRQVYVAVGGGAFAHGRISDGFIKYSTDRKEWVAAKIQWPQTPE